MQNRRSFFGSMLGGLAACFVGRKATAQQPPKTSQETFFYEPFIPDDSVYLGVHEGEFLFSKIQFHPENEGEVAFQIPDSFSSLWDFYEILRKCPATTGLFRSSLDSFNGTNREIILCLSNCKLWRQPNSKGT